MSQLCEGLNIYPQVLQNVRVADKAGGNLQTLMFRQPSNRLLQSLAIQDVYLCVESGTEPVIRVMVEAESEEICQKYVDMVVAKLK